MEKPYRGRLRSPGGPSVRGSARYQRSRSRACATGDGRDQANGDIDLRKVLRSVARNR